LKACLGSRAMVQDEGGKRKGGGVHTDKLNIGGLNGHSCVCVVIAVTPNKISPYDSFLCFRTSIASKLPGLDIGDPYQLFFSRVTMYSQDVVAVIHLF